MAPITNHHLVVSQLFRGFLQFPWIPITCGFPGIPTYRTDRKRGAQAQVPEPAEPSDLESRPRPGSGCASCTPRGAPGKTKKNDVSAKEKEQTKPSNRGKGSNKLMLFRRWRKARGGLTRSNC